MKKFTILLFILIFFSSLFAQIQIPEKSKQSPWHFGGGLGFSIGNHSSGIHIAPSIGYMLNSNIELGTTLAYTYNKYNNYKSNIFSLGTFVNYHVIPELFFRSHYEHFRGNRKNDNYSNRFTENALWIGGGYQSSGNIRFQTGIMYNVLYKKDKSIFSGPLRPFAAVSLSF